MEKYSQCKDFSKICCKYFIDDTWELWITQKHPRKQWGNHICKFEIYNIHFICHPNANHISLILILSIGYQSLMVEVTWKRGFEKEIHLISSTKNWIKNK